MKGCLFFEKQKCRFVDVCGFFCYATSAAAMVSLILYISIDECDASSTQLLTILGAGSWHSYDWGKFITAQFAQQKEKYSTFGQHRINIGLRNIAQATQLVWKLNWPAIGSQGCQRLQHPLCHLPRRWPAQLLDLAVNSWSDRMG